MNKRFFIFMSFLLISVFTFANKVNPMKDYISDEVFKEAEKKFQEDKNFFKSEVIKKTGTGGTVKTGNELNNIFIKVETIIRKDRKWGCIIFFKEKNSSSVETTKRKVILGNTIIKVDKKKYFLSPYEDGIEIREITSGNTIHLKVNEGR